MQQSKQSLSPTVLQSFGPPVIKHFGPLFPQSSCPPVSESPGPPVHRSSPPSLFSSFAFGLGGLTGTKCEAASEHVIHTPETEPLN